MLKLRGYCTACWFGEDGLQRWSPSSSSDHEESVCYFNPPFPGKRTQFAPPGRPGEFEKAFSAAAYAHVMKSYTSQKGCEHSPRKTVPKQKTLSNGFSFALRLSVTQQNPLVGWEHLRHSWLWGCHAMICRQPFPAAHDCSDKQSQVGLLGPQRRLLLLKGSRGCSPCQH